MENTLTAAKVNSARHKRQRLLNSQAFAEKAACLVKFVWAVHCRRSEDPDWEMADFAVSGPMDDQDVDEASELQITPELFTFLRTFDELKRLLHALDVTDEDQVDLFDTLDVDGGGMIDLEELIVGISKLRGDARRSDIVGVSLVVRCIQAESASGRGAAVELQLSMIGLSLVMCLSEWFQVLCRLFFRVFLCAFS